MKIRMFAFVCVAFIALGTVHASEEVKGALDVPSGPGSAPEATGGPDTFGNTWVDQADGCTYSWVTLDSPTLVVSGDDAGADQALGGPAFNFYGVDLTTVMASTNGYLSGDAGSSAGDLSNDCPLPASPSTGSGARFYLVHDDLITDVTWQYFATCPRPHDETGFGAKGCNVFQWDGRHYGGTPDTLSFQMILYDDVYEIVYQVATDPEGGSGSTTGIQNATATDGLTYSCNTAGGIVPGTTAVCFFHPAPIPVELQSFSAE